MRVHKSLAASLVGLMLSAASIGCGSGGKPAEDPSDLLEHEADMEAAEALGDEPSEASASDPDMEYIKEMARRGGVQAKKCNVKDNAGPRGVAHVEVTFQTKGHSGPIAVQPPHDGTPIGDCIKRAFQGLIVPSFEGGAVKVEAEIDFSKKDDE